MMILSPFSEVNYRHVKFLKKNAGQGAENQWFFLKICFRKRQSFALKFDPLLYRIRFFAGLIPGDDSRFAIFVGFIKLYSRLDYLYLYYSVYIQALNWYRFFSDFEMLYLTAIRNYQASLRYQYWFFSATSAKLSQEMAFNKKKGKTMSIFLKIRDFF